jgi:hypothetical protein
VTTPLKVPLYAFPVFFRSAEQQSLNCSNQMQSVQSKIEHMFATSA